MVKRVLRFYDLKKKEKFETDNYEVIERNNRFYAIAKSSSDNDCWRIISRKDYEEAKEK